MTRATGIGQGTAQGVGTANTIKPLQITSENQSARAKSGWLKRKMRAYSCANPDSRVSERAPNRLEIAELAQRGMPEALQALELIVHRSRSDVARVQAFNALKETAYGKDQQSFAVKVASVDPNSLTDEELAAIIKGGQQVLD